MGIPSTPILKPLEGTPSKALREDLRGRWWGDSHQGPRALEGPPMTLWRSSSGANARPIPEGKPITLPMGPLVFCIRVKGTPYHGTGSCGRHQSLLTFGSTRPECADGGPGGGRGGKGEDRGGDKEFLSEI